MPDLRAHPELRTVAEEQLPEATRRLIRTADGLTEEEYAEPSGLPGWSRAHLVAHLALNAEGLAAALAGVVEGRRVPMYASQETRDSDIADLAGAAPSAIRSRLLGGCTDLADALAAVPDDAWETTIERVPGGPVFTVADVPVMRLREVEIHHADLVCGYDRSSWSPAFAAAVLDAALARSSASSPFRAHATDLDRTWSFGEGGPTVTGSATDLAWWATGRGRGEGLTAEGGELPGIGGW